MADGDRAAVGIDLLVGDTQLAHTVERLRSERLVELHDVDVFYLQSVSRQELGHREDRAYAHLFGPATGNRETAEHAHRLYVELLGSLGRHQHGGRSTVAHLAGVAGCHAAVFFKHRLERRQSLERGGRTVALVVINVDLHHLGLASLLVFLCPGGRQGSDLFGHDARLERRRVALLAAQRESVLVLARDVVALSHYLGRVAHAHVNTRPFFVDLLAENTVLIGLSLAQGDALHAAAYGHLGALSNYLVRGHRHGLQARRTEAVDRGSGHRIG